MTSLKLDGTIIRPRNGWMHDSPAALARPGAFCLLSAVQTLEWMSAMNQASFGFRRRENMKRETLVFPNHRNL